jgi:epsilon-lactone hydrolase
MQTHFNSKPFHLSGPWQYQVRSLMTLYWSVLFVTFRRWLRGPRRPTWSWSFEAAIDFLRRQTVTGFDMTNIAAGREYEDSLVMYSPALTQVTVEPVAAPVRGHWYHPKAGRRNVTTLYLHGGGYAYYSKAHQNMLIPLVTLAAQSRTFALDYRLIPEHPFPAQLEDAQAAYRWLLETGVEPARLVVMGDSAGGNLTLTLLLALRDAGLPLPALAVCIAPWTCVENPGDSMTSQEPYDWVQKRMADRWADWLCKGAQPQHPLISPIYGDLKGLPPIYIQAGEAEILHDMIRAFTDTARAQGANVKLDVWKDMNHDFQSFGDIIPESRDALHRIGEAVETYLPA